MEIEYFPSQLKGLKQLQKIFILKQLTPTALIPNLNSQENDV